MFENGFFTRLGNMHRYISRVILCLVFINNFKIIISLSAYLFVTLHPINAEGRFACLDWFGKTRFL